MKQDTEKANSTFNSVVKYEKYEFKSKHTIKITHKDVTSGLLRSWVELHWKDCKL